MFEEHWEPHVVEEGLASGLLVKGTLHVPSFHTDTAFVIAEVAHRPDPIDDEEVEDDPKRVVWIPVTGFIGRNRALHGDTVVALPSWQPWRRGERDSPGGPPGEATSATTRAAAASDAADGSAAPSSSAAPAGDAAPHEEALPPPPPAPPAPPPAEQDEQAQQAPAQAAAAGAAPGAAATAQPAPPQLSSELERQREELRNTVLARLSQTEEGALPLSVLGQSTQVRKLRKGFGNLAKALRQLSDCMEVVQEGTPPETVVRLLPGQRSRGAAEEVTKEWWEPQQQPPSEQQVEPGAEALAVPFTPPPPPADGADAGAVPDTAAVTQSAPANDEPSGQPTDAPAAQGSWERARCRVVAISERRASAGEIVAVFRPPAPVSGEDGIQARGLEPLKVQPRDRRFPAFWVQEDEAIANAGSEASSASTSPSSMLRAQAASAQQPGGGQPQQPSSLLCVMQFAGWPTESLSPYARILEVLGPQGAAHAEADALLAFYGLEWRPFAQELETALRESFPDGDALVEQEVAAGRREDLRALRCVTIDPPTAKDLDDAVSIAPGQQVPDTFRIGVHVADVTHFVAAGSAVDREARRRATTVYLVYKVYPMLPRWLSEKLCSLIPDGDHLAFSVFFTLNRDGQLVDSDPPAFSRTAIRTVARLNYDEVDAALNPQPGASETQLSGEVLSDLQALAEVTAARRRQRIGDGTVVLERTNVAFELDEDSQVVGLREEAAASQSHHLIEELMVLANHLVALRLVEAGDEEAAGARPAAISDGGGGEAALPQPLLRRHPDSEAKVRQKVFEILPEDLSAQAPANAGLPELVAWLQERLPGPTLQAVCADIMTEFKEAEYVVAEHAVAQTAEVAHWALALPAYMHFTSPIRRYADVLVHRRLGHILAGNAARTEGTGTVATCGDTGSDQHQHHNFLEDLKDAVKRCNAKKRDAYDASRDAVQMALAEHVHRTGGLRVEDAVITRIHLPGKGAGSSRQQDGNAPEASGTEAASPQRQSFHQRLKARTYKEALEFYVPAAQCSRSVSFEALNISLVEEAEEQATDSTAGSEPGTGEAGGAGRICSSVRVRLRQPQVAAASGVAADDATSPSASTAAAATAAVDAAAASDGDDVRELRILEPLAVLLVSSGSGAEQQEGLPSRHWTIRLPWALPGDAAAAAPPATPA